jgi:endonuclease YncB( thermonuclease family)
VGPTLQGTVKRVIDGDTLVFETPGRAPIVVRLRDVDAPEICQPGGPESRQALVDLAQDKPARLREVAHDAHGRTVGTVWVDEIDLSRRMVEDGQAWSARTRWDRGPLVKQERMAQALHRGLHAAPGAEMPRAFRARHGPCPKTKP